MPLLEPICGVPINAGPHEENKPPECRQQLRPYDINASAPPTLYQLVSELLPESFGPA
jgi:hypothetical protein